MLSKACVKSGGLLNGREKNKGSDKYSHQMIKRLSGPGVHGNKKETAVYNIAAILVEGLSGVHFRQNFCRELEENGQEQSPPKAFLKQNLYKSPY
ncbi:hypothetical protein T265_11350 [Opisthorchis viverrini]|uniref:Uncharacterized protein n=1 Tax=Opisthorchis viverrini TaxID=6198 RepID=A0A074ZXU2_OPIVI|nr:hypothetical protein T265_11350 [Opisthorchis viverrini]KER20014.1 hypothetical protein T265_11350 [Opisthorchis viverrini]